MQKIAVILPIWNEASTVAELIERIENALSESVSFLFVDDGSTDETVSVIQQINLKNIESSKSIIQLARNFGHQPALMAGLHHVPESVEIIVVMDADLQDKPEDIPQLIAKVREGFDCAYAVRKPHADSFIINTLTRCFYVLLEKLSKPALPAYAGTFSAFNRKTLELLLSFKEIDIFFPGLRAYVGGRQSSVVVSRSPRKDGSSRVGFFGLLNLSLNGLLGFSSLPMRLLLFFGICIATVCGLVGTMILLLRFTGVIQVMGFTSLALFLLTLLGIQMICIGLVGEYVGKLFVESKGRPRWIVRDILK
jgi:glycosyltransferase involved in cell wall biosynthesis